MLAMAAHRRDEWDGVSPINPASAFRLTVNIAQACAIARVCRRTVYYWLEAGKVEYIRTAGGKIRIYADSLFRPDRRYSA